MAELRTIGDGVRQARQVRVATLSNIDISSAPATIDGLAMAEGEAFLLAGQTAPAQNGVYVYPAAAGQAATRRGDADSFAKLKAARFVVEEGTHAARVFQQTQVAGVINADPLTFKRQLADNAAIADLEDMPDGTAIANVSGDNPGPPSATPIAVLLAAEGVETGAQVNRTAQATATLLVGDGVAVSTLQGGLGFSKALDGFQAHAADATLTAAMLFKLNVVTADNVTLTLPDAPFTGVAALAWYAIANRSSTPTTVVVDDPTGTPPAEQINGDDRTSITIPAGRTVFVYFHQASPAPQWYAEILETAELPVEIGVALSDATSDLTTGTDVVVIHATFDGTLKAFAIGAGGAPTGAAIITDVKKNGTSMMTTPPEIAKSAFFGKSTDVDGAQEAFVEGDAFAFDITQVGSTEPGKNLTGYLYMTRPL